MPRRGGRRSISGSQAVPRSGSRSRPAASPPGRRHCADPPARVRAWSRAAAPGCSARNSFHSVISTSASAPARRIERVAAIVDAGGQQRLRPAPCPRGRRRGSSRRRRPGAPRSDSDGASRMSSVSGLKVRPSTAIVLPRTEPPQACDHPHRHAGLARVVDRDGGLHQPRRRAVVLRGAHQRQRVLGEARAAVARPGMQELAADAAVQPDAARHVVHIGADLLAQIGHLVDEGDLHRQERVGGVFGQFRRLDAGEHDRRLDQIERAVELAQHLARAVALGADHHAVRPHEVADRVALAQEFRVGGDVECPGPAGWRGRSPRSRRPVPTGTVDLVTMTA